MKLVFMVTEEETLKLKLVFMNHQLLVVKMIAVIMDLVLMELVLAQITTQVITVEDVGYFYSIF